MPGGAPAHGVEKTLALTVVGPQGSVEHLADHVDPVEALGCSGHGEVVYAIGSDEREDEPHFLGPDRGPLAHVVLLILGPQEDFAPRVFVLRESRSRKEHKCEVIQIQQKYRA